uniref:Uncharacterized protein n=1 Tax=Arundo donax TaxID=35708 RepID=A0A0A9EGU7_ARUDO
MRRSRRPTQKGSFFLRSMESTSRIG